MKVGDTCPIIAKRMTKTAITIFLRRYLRSRAATSSMWWSTIDMRPRIAPVASWPVEGHFVAVISFDSDCSCFLGGAPPSVAVTSPGPITGISQDPFRAARLFFGPHAFSD